MQLKDQDKASKWTLSKDCCVNDSFQSQERLTKYGQEV